MDNNGTMASSDFSSGIIGDFASQLIPFVPMVLCHRPDETSPVPSSTVTTSRTPYTGEFFAAVFQVLHRFSCLHLACQARLSLAPLAGPNISVLQVSLYVTGCCFAPSSRRVTTLRDSQSPGYTGCLLPGGLTLTRTGLSPASRR